ncbi:MAG: MFS transporter [Proteobacteria bacterium]|nr:MFS transporter [Pseudomonadota bacterium]
MSQFNLLKQKRFLPFFLTQFFGAFNDNVFKNALGILVTYKLVGDSAMLLSLAAGLFILPFFLFSAIAGQVADKYEKSKLIRIVKLFEIGIMCLAAIGFYLENKELLFTVLFLMGSQSSLFGPVKYGYLPQKLKKEELIGGNGLIESSTFLAILIGTIVGTLLLNFDTYLVISLTIISIAVAGFISSTFIPNTPAASPEITVNLNIITETYRNVKFLPSNRVVFLSILAISWFWFYGSIFLMQIQNFTKNVLYADEVVVTALLSMFSVGIAVGSLLCEKLSGKRVEIGLVPLGAIGMVVFGWDLAATAHNWSHFDTVMNFKEFLLVSGSYRVLIDLAMIGVSGGIYIVPLYALVQERSDKKSLSRVIAGNNIINALFMVVAAVMAYLVLSVWAMSIPDLFKITVALNILVCLYIFTVVPEFLLRLLAWLLVSTVYRVKPKGMENIPHEGAALLCCNHISFVDPLILGGHIRRPVRFIMYYKIFNVPILKWFFKAAKAIPIAGYKEDPEMFEQAFATVKKALADGDLVCIFPEGGLTPDGSLQEFKAGLERIIKDTPVPVIPMSLNNLWGSIFSRKDKMLKRRPRKFWANINLNVGKPIKPENANKEIMFDRVSALKQDSLE